MLKTENADIPLLDIASSKPYLYIKMRREVMKRKDPMPYFKWSVTRTIK